MDKNDSFKILYFTGLTKMYKLLQTVFHRHSMKGRCENGHENSWKLFLEGYGKSWNFVVRKCGNPVLIRDVLGSIYPDLTHKTTWPNSSLIKNILTRLDWTQPAVSQNKIYEKTGPDLPSNIVKTVIRPVGRPDPRANLTKTF